MKKFKAQLEDIGERADVFVAKKLPLYSRSTSSKLFEQKKVQVNSKPVKFGYKLKLGDQIVIDDKILEVKAEAPEVNVLFEDDNVVVMNKAAGVLTHSKGSFNNESTIADFLKTKITDKEMTGNKAGIVHRLDRATSGVIIGAKNQETHKHLQKQFSTRKTKKTYIAAVHGRPEYQEAVIDAPIARNPRRPQTFRVASNGKTAKTNYRIIKTVEIDNKLVSVLELRPESGRTHQLRVHTSYIGHPIVGDLLYGQDKHSDMYLHSSTLELTLPGGKRMVFKADPPKYLKDLAE